MQIEIQYFLIIMMRITSFIWQSPGFSFRGMPSGTKIVLSIVLSMSVIGNMNMLTYEVLSTGMFSFILIKELLLGLSFGYITQLFLVALKWQEILLISK